MCWVCREDVYTIPVRQVCKFVQLEVHTYAGVPESSGRMFRVWNAQRGGSNSKERVGGWGGGLTRLQASQTLTHPCTHSHEQGSRC